MKGHDKHDGGLQIRKMYKLNRAAKRGIFKGMIGNDQTGDHLSSVLYWW